MQKPPRRLGVRQADPRPTLVPVRRYWRRLPRPKTWQQLLAGYRQAHRRLWHAVLQPIRPPLAAVVQFEWPRGRSVPVPLLARYCALFGSYDKRKSWPQQHNR